MQKCDICSKLRDASASGWHTITHQELKDSPRLIAYALRIKAAASPDRMVSLGHGLFFRLETDDLTAEVPSAMRDAYIAEVEQRYGESDWRLCPRCYKVHTGGKSPAVQGVNRPDKAAREQRGSPPGTPPGNLPGEDGERGAEPAGDCQVPIPVQCPCGNEWQVADSLAGKRILCSACKERVFVPAFGLCPRCYSTTPPAVLDENGGLCSHCLQGLQSPPLRGWLDRFLERQASLPRSSPMSKAEYLKYLLAATRPGFGSKEESAALYSALIAPEPEVAVADLLQAARSDSAYIRNLATRALETLGPPEAAAGEVLLQAVMRGGIGGGRDGLPLLLSKLVDVGPGRVVPALTGDLEHPDPWRRARAADLLARFAGGASSALPALDELANDDDENVRIAAKRAARVIRQAPAKAAPPLAGAGKPSPPASKAAGVIRVGCPCGKRCKVPAALAGKRIKCPSCGVTLSVPSPPDT